MNQKQLISKDMKVADVIERHPELAVVLAGYGLSCVGCGLSGVDTLESGAKLHGMDEETIEMMIKDSNAVVEMMKKD